MTKRQVHLFIDPFGRSDSGVSAYLAAAIPLVEASGRTTQLVVRDIGEALPDFRNRVADEVRLAGESADVIVEAPETDAVTANVSNDSARIHIRLHFSRQLGQKLQHLKIDRGALALEQREIARADMISSPSHAAVEASRLLFELPGRVACYPNPAIPAEARNIPDKLGDRVVFLGRFQPLKGIDTMVGLAEALPECDFLFAGIGPLPAKTAGLPNLSIMDGAQWTSETLAQAARMVVVPSLFETASMVGIEAISLGIPVICWSHLGLVEYAGPTRVTPVDGMAWQSLADAVRRQWSVTKPTEGAAEWSQQLNRRFLLGMDKTHGGSQGNYMPRTPSSDAVSAGLKHLLQKVSSQKMGSSGEPSWKRKLRKLKRDPKQFFADAKFLRAFWKAGGGDNSTPRSIRASDKESAGGPLTIIDTQGAIKFRQPPAKPRGVVTAFLFPTDREEDAADLMLRLEDLQNFPYVQSPMLQVGMFDPDQDPDPVDFIQRIDVKNKSHASMIDNYILLDPPPVLIEGIRACGTDHRMLVISTGSQHDPGKLRNVDVLIVVGEDHPLRQNNEARRLFAVDDFASVPNAIRRAVQENAPKSPDMLLPLIGFQGDHRDEFEAVSASSCQGLIRASREGMPENGTMSAICRHLAETMTDLAVTESVYLRYRSQCDRIDEVDARTEFLLFSLRDGILFDVH